MGAQPESGRANGLTEKKELANTLWVNVTGQTHTIKPVAADSRGSLQLGSDGTSALTLKTNADGELQLANYTSLTQSNRAGSRSWTGITA